MLEFNALLRDEAIDPEEVAMLRHQPVESRLKRVLPWLAVDRPDLFKAWQQVQWTAAERIMTRAGIVAAFIGQEPGRATFAGISRVGPHRQLDYEGYMNFPGNAELMSLGMTGMLPDEPAPLAFELEELDVFRPWVGRLVINWPKPERVWARWAARGVFSVHAIVEESRFERGMPDWSGLNLTWSELAVLPRTWRSALAEWRGIYFIFDRERGLGYVGSAGGAENILGRWSGYAETGHGGNKRLRSSRPEHLVFSILERTSPDLSLPDLIRLENSWKERLHSRSHGLNEN